MYKRSNANFAELIHPAKDRLCSTPTPITLLKELNKESPVTLSVKRDDLTGCTLTGSEVRALEYVLHEARVKASATTIITCGLPNSPHVRAISIAARQLGFTDTHLFLLGPPPPNNSGGDGNLFFNYLAGAKIYYLTPEQYANRERIMNRLARTLDEKNQNAFIIQDYFGQPSALWGYISMIKEMLDTHMRFPYSHVFLPSSSGIALAGVLVARSMLKLHFHVIAFHVSDTPVAAVSTRIDRMISAFNTQYGCNYKTGIFTISDRYMGPGGPGVSYPEEIYWVQRLARLEGIFLDPITTGKAFYGLMDQAVKRAFAPTDQVLFIHTGNPFTMLENRDLFSFPQSTPTLDRSILDVENLGAVRQEDAEYEGGMGEAEKEEIRHSKAFELDIEEDTEKFRLLIK